MTEPNQKRLSLAALLEEDAAPTNPRICYEPECGNFALPGDEYCAEHGVQGSKSNGHAKRINPNDVEDEDNPVPKRVPCIKCKVNPKRNPTSDYCQRCWGERMCSECGINKAGFPGNQNSPYCSSCVKERNSNGTSRSQAALTEIRDKKKLEAIKRGEVCYRCGRGTPDPGHELCFGCEQHETPRAKAPLLGRMPESCMYGWLGDFARTLGCPLDAAYPAVLAVAAGYGVPPTATVRSNLYVNLIGAKGTGKTLLTDRITRSWAPATSLQVVRKYPGSEIGLIQLLGGKKAKDMEEGDYTPKPYLLVQDEMRATFAKMDIQNSALPNILNQLFYQDSYGTASKQGHWECCARLSVIGGLTCDGPDEFADIYGVETTTGTYDRTIFGVLPGNWEFDHEWQPTLADDGDIVRRKPKTCSIPTEIFQMASEWRKVNHEDRRRLAELALRIALITGSLNHESEVTPECMRCALDFVEWQEAVRRKYNPSETDDLDGKAERAVIRALEKYDWIEWRQLCQRHSLYKAAKSSVRLNRVKRAMIFEELIEEEHELNSDGSPSKEKTGRVWLKR